MPAPSRTSPRRAPASTRRGEPATEVRGAPWRVLFLVAALAVAAAIAVPPFAGWWTQRAQIGEVQAQVREERDRTNELKAQREQLQDDAHLRDLARTRLDYAQPGEKRYHVLTQSESAGGATVAAGHDAGDTPWYEQLWGSVEQSAAGVAADAPPAPDDTTPDGPPAAEEPVREREEPVPDGVPDLITEDGFDPADIPASDLSAGEDDPAAEGEQ